MHPLIRNKKGVTILEVLIGMSVFALVSLGIASTLRNTLTFSRSTFADIMAQNYAKLISEQLKSTPKEILDQAITDGRISMLGLGTDPYTRQNMTLNDFTTPSNSPFIVYLNKETGEQLELNIIPVVTDHFTTQQVVNVGSTFFPRYQVEDIEQNVGGFMISVTPIYINPITGNEVRGSTIVNMKQNP